MMLYTFQQRSNYIRVKVCIGFYQPMKSAENQKLPTFKFLNCPNILEKATTQCSIFPLADKESLDAKLFGPGIVTSPKGYTNTLKIFYLLKLIASYPCLATESVSSDDCQKLEGICDLLKNAVKI